jgi:hypothetical protein
MAKDTDVNAVTEALDHLMAVQERQGGILTRLEQRRVPDIDGLTRRLEEVADAVERQRRPEVPTPRLAWVHVGVLLLAIFAGWGLCWATVRYLPNGALPPGFTRAAPAPQKGRF